MDDLEISFLMRAERERRRRRDIEFNRIRFRSVRDASDPFSVTNEIFKGVYRISKELAKELIKELRPLMVAPRRSSAIPIEIKSADMITMYRNSSRSSARCISMLKGAIKRVQIVTLILDCARAVSLALLKKSLLHLTPEKC
ncbi:hypothetical protein J437_LFUL013871 [Ladona fulva]|uniref:Uncharacterized protein n=1 Tax=Ladona fulva TaxID=123851 RepID=A0A8K0KGW8_LADFU|nr:hypothetical protein J437_LFUL013871 [Ladona fulva]